MTQDYFDIIAKAKKELNYWVNLEVPNYHSLQFIFPFVEGDKHIKTWIFYKMNQDIYENEVNGSTSAIKSKFLNLIKKYEMPIEVIQRMEFEVDSDENVKENYEGNYFYRLR